VDRDRQRLEQMVDYATHGSCRRAQLVGHFGDTRSAGGFGVSPARCCDNCCL